MKKRWIAGILMLVMLAAMIPIPAQAAETETYTVTYDANGGIGKPADQTGTSGEILWLSETAPTWMGYNFVGWSTDPDDGTVEHMPGGLYSAEVDVTLYAVWEELYIQNGPATEYDAPIRVAGRYACYKFVPGFTGSVQIRILDEEGGSISLFKGEQMLITAPESIGCSLQYDVTAFEEYCIYIWAMDSESTGTVKFLVEKGSTVTFDANGGEGAPENGTSYYASGMTIPELAPTLEGHSFLGWADSANAAAAQYAAGDTFVTTEDTVLYAVWAKAGYTVTFDANGGSGAPANQFRTPGTILYLDDAIPTRFGYNFEGWSTDATSSTVTYRPGDPYTEDADVKLYAVWICESISYFAFDYDDDDVTREIYYPDTCIWVKYIPDESNVIRLKITNGINATLVLHDYNGYVLNSATSDEDYLINSVTEGKTYYIQIDPDDGYYLGEVKLNISKSGALAYDANGGTGAPTAQLYWCYGRTMLSERVPTRRGYTFLGWSKSASATRAEYEPGSYYNNTVIHANDIVLYAVWSPYTYTVSYDANGGDSAPDAQTKSYDKPLTLSSSVPSRFGYTFLGWSLSSNASTVDYQPGDSFELEEDTTLYAVWSKLVSVRIVTDPVKTVYQLGESLDITGLTFRVTYSDGSSKILDGSAASISITMDTVGPHVGTVSYGGRSDTFTVVVKDADQVNPLIRVSTQSAFLGEQVQVAIALFDNPGVASMALKVNYDPSVLTLVEVTDSGLLGDAVHSDNKSACPYPLNWVNDLVTTNFTANGDVVVLTFLIAEDAEVGKTPITVSYEYDNYEIYNADGEEVWFDIQNGYVDVMDVLIGDVNGDRKVNVQDRLILTRYLAGMIGYTADMINMKAADVNCDGRVNAQDRMILTRYLAQWTAYPELPHR